MKKITVLLIVILCTFTLANAEMYSSQYLNNLKTCTPFKETKNANVQTGNSSMPSIPLITKESVLGWKNGKCITLSSAYSTDLGQTIMASRCAFSQEQLNSIVKKINKADNGDSQALEALKQELQQYISDGYTCKVKTMFGDDND